MNSLKNRSTPARVIILSGPSGSGKTTLYKKLLDLEEFRGRLKKSISVTTRPIRQNEVNGKDYFFVSQRMFQYKKRAGHFLESQQVFDNYYGTPKKSVRALLKKGLHVLLCIDVQGAKIVRKAYPDAVTIFIKTARYADLEKRLLGRGSGHTDNVKLRLQTARKELEESKSYQHVIINDHLNKAFRQLKDIIRAEIR